MSSHASANSEIKHLYNINSHFCYAFKFGIVTNGLGIIRHISFYNKDFMSTHPDIIVNKKFDSTGLYKSLLTGDTFGKQNHFSKAYIPLNTRAGLENPDYSMNADDVPCCPHNSSLPMKYERTSKLRSGITRYKFVCPKMHWVYDKSTQKCHRKCYCDNPCATSTCSRIVYIYPEKDLRTYPGTICGTEEWDSIYKIRTVVERDINHIKDNLCLAGHRIQSEKTLHADLILAGITQLITVVLVNEIHQPKYIRSLEPLIA